MEEKNTAKRREWIKNVAIIFLVIMLILTFFSNTIMNYSLPEVATQYVQNGTITAKVRGTGKVEAADPYHVIAKESRVIASVAVKQGDTVEKDQVLYYLEDAESEELLKAQDELEDLELAYMKGLFGSNVSPDVISKVANGNVDSFGQLQARVTQMQNALDEAKKRVEECQNTLNTLNLQSSVKENDAKGSTLSDELDKENATIDLANAETAFNNQKANQVAKLNAEIKEVQNQITDLETLISNGQSMIAGGTTTGTTGTSGTGSSSSTLYDKAKQTVNDKLTVLVTAGSGAPTQNNKTVSSTSTEAQVKEWYNDIDWNNGWFTPEKQLDLEAKYGEYRVAVDEMNTIASTLKDYGSVDDRQGQLSTLKSKLSSLQSKLAEVNAITVSSSGSVQEAQQRLDQANKNISEITTANQQSALAYQNQILNAEAALKNAQAVYDLLKEEQTALTSDINAELDLSKTNRDIEEKKEQIAKLKEKSMGAAVTAPVAGIVSNLAYVAGETTKAEEDMAVIQPEGKGFTLSISVTTEQAKKVQIGDMAELQNAWYYDDASIILSAIKPDPEDPGTKKLLVFDVSGSSIQADQNLNISVGQRSQEYELVVPNSAIREDNDGKFILTVESKSSPLGNRYIATRVGVEVIASDDNNTAISAPLYGWEYVITTSTKPVEAGKQVRLADS